MDDITLKSLLEKDTIFPENTLITKENLAIIDTCLLAAPIISEECFGVYKKFADMKQNAPEGMKNELFKVIRNYQKEKLQNKEYYDALLLNRFLIVKSKLEAQSYYDIAEILLNIQNRDLSLEFLNYYREKETNLPLKIITTANFYNFQLKDYKSAIKYYEQYLNIEESKPVIFTTLGNSYKKAYQDDSLKEQIYYYEKGYQLKPNDRLILHSLAFNYEKLGDRQKADKYYKELLENNPTDIDYYNYGGFLISCGDLYNGHKYLTHRFLINDINLQYPKGLDKNKKWDFKTDISDKILLVHYEQGFGDSIMYCRFLPGLKKLCRKVIFVVQDGLYDLIKNSKKIAGGIEILPEDTNIANIEYDYNIALIDVPFAVKISAENLPYPKGYLDVPEQKVKNYTKQFIKNSNCLKVGIAYHGNKTSNYNGRDIDFSKFSKLLELKNIDFYSFNMEDENDNRIVNLGKTFENFTDTACALKNMDIVISTDNVILNLAGALGVKTIGLFNKYPNFRWFKLTGDNTGYYDTVKPLQAEQNDRWMPVISEVMNILKQQSDKKSKNILK